MQRYLCSLLMVVTVCLVSSSFSEANSHSSLIKALANNISAPQIRVLLSKIGILNSIPNFSTFEGELNNDYKARIRLFEIMIKEYPQVVMEMMNYNKLLFSHEKHTAESLLNDIDLLNQVRQSKISAKYILNNILKEVKKEDSEIKISGDHEDAIHISMSVEEILEIYGTYIRPSDVSRKNGNRFGYKKTGCFEAVLCAGSKGKLSLSVKCEDSICPQCGKLEWKIGANKPVSVTLGTTGMGITFSTTR